MNKPDFDPTTVKNLNVEAFEQWLGYKASKKQKYKTVLTLRAAADKLASLGDDEAQQEAVKQSISNNWSGLFAVTPKKLASGEKPKRTAEQVAAADAAFAAQQAQAARGWEEEGQTPFAKLKLCDALWSRYTINPGPETPEKLDWLKGVIAMHLREADAKQVVGDPHLMTMVWCFFGPGGARRMQERAAA